MLKSISAKFQIAKFLYFKSFHANQNVPAHINDFHRIVYQVVISGNQVNIGNKLIINIKIHIQESVFIIELIILFILKHFNLY